MTTETQESITKIHAKQIEALETIVANLIVEIDQLRAEKQRREKLILESITSIHDTLAEQDKHINMVEDNNNKISLDLTNAQQQIDDVSDELKQTTKDVAQAKQDINALDSRVTTLEEEVKLIKDMLDVLRDSIDEQREQQEFQEWVKHHPKLFCFYTTFWGKLDKLFDVGKIVKYVDLSPNKRQIAVHVGAEITQTVVELPEAVPLAALATKPVSLAIRLSEYLFQGLYGAHRSERIGKMADIHPSSAILAKMAELIARKFTISFQERIACLPNEKAISHVAKHLSSSLKHATVKLHTKNFSNNNDVKLDIQHSIKLLMEGILDENKNNKDKIKILAPKDFTELQECSMRKFLLAAAYQYPTKKKQDGRVYARYYKKDGNISNNPYLFRHLSREEWKELKPSRDKSTHWKNRNTNWADNRPTDCPDPVTTNVHGKLLTKF